MKINFFTISGINFYFNLLIIALLICFTACNKRKPKPVFNLNQKGAQVVATYNDSTPQVVYYYKVDKKGNPTDEKIGEAFYYDNKQEYVGGGLKDGKRDGKWYAFFKDGSVQTEAFYIEGLEHGAYNVYQENGKPLYKGHYDHGNCDGTWIYYDKDGKETRRVATDENSIGCGFCQKCLKLIKNL